MSEITSDSLATKKQRAAVESFLGALVKGSKTVTLYKEGHAIIGQVSSRVNQLLKNAIGEEQNLMFELKAKTVLLDEMALEETDETIRFATSLHALGIGQVILTTRLEDIEMYEFMRLLVWKPTEEMTLTDMQKELQTKKVDGLQLISILSFVVTGEQEEDTRNPGELNEEQLTAILAAQTIPDFLHIILKQAEVVNNRTAEEIVFSIDQVLHRDTSIEAFQDEMNWDVYDGRIRVRWYELRGDIQGLKKWTQATLVSALTTFTNEEFESLKNHHTHDANASFSYALQYVHFVLDNPVGEQQPRFALYAYARLLEDLGRIGDLRSLLKEFDLWRKMAQDPKWGAYLATLRDEVQKKVPSPALAGSVAKKAGEFDPDGDEIKSLHDFVLTVGKDLVPGLLEEFRNTTQKEERQRLTKFLADLYKRFGGKPLINALKDSDYFFVIGIVGILAELGLADLAKHIGHLLNHKHEKVRATVIGQFRRTGGATAARALTDFISNGKHNEQAQIAATTLSLIPIEGVDDLLFEAYNANEDYDIRLAIVTALGRHPGPDTADFLRTVAHQTLKERFFDFIAKIRGAKMSLRVAARKSLKQIEGDPEAEAKK
ncbi:MAG: hypothetical protein COB53_01715 [Elusimicrobia bacterium]|nr:MAG: hypothetical protein COB53_01715 [Elusimicrobiota bacterium]